MLQRLINQFNLANYKTNYAKAMLFLSLLFTNASANASTNTSTNAQPIIASLPEIAVTSGFLPL